MAIIDLFEELDSDNDGNITYQDFITYYKDSSISTQNQLTQKERSRHTIFNKIQKPSNAASGKTGMIQIDPVF